MVFIVTGASSGIGFAVAKSLALRHHNVLAVARNIDRLESLKSDSGDRIQIVPADLATESGRNSVLEAINTLGKVDGIVHGAGSLIRPAEYRHLNACEIVANMNVHVAVPVAMNCALEDKLAGGRILYIDSYSANNLRVGWSGYSIVKAAAQMAARSAAQEMTQSRVIRVFPGAVKTPLVESVLASQRNSPTLNLFKELESNNEISEPSIIGEFIANILVSATDQQLKQREIWDFSNPDDRIF